MSQKRILVVEDERIVALDLQDRLQELGYSVPATAARGPDAIRLALEHRPDLILMDIRLRGEMDGIETAAQIQEQLDVPIIYLTAYADRDTVDRAKETKPYGYILKPFDAREIQTTIEMALYKHETDAKLRAYVAELGRLQVAVEQVPESIAITDEDGSVIYVNPAYEQETGFSREEAVGQHVIDLNHSQAVNGDAVRLQAALSEGSKWWGRLNHVRKDGTPYTSEGSITPVRDEEGRVVHYVGVQRDVTREVELEEQYRAALKMEAVGRLAAGIAHDFNNLLTAINGYAELLACSMSPEDPDRDMPLSILSAGERAADLVRQLLSFARKEIIELQLLELNELVTGVADILRRTIGEHIELRLDLRSDLWMVEASPTQIDRIIVNLAVNARDAMPHGGVLSISTANVVLERDDPALDMDTSPGEYVMLSISDTGVGMSREVQAHLFEPFFTTKELGRGTGLGLATVYGIVKQNGGCVYVSSTEGQGATFQIYLPRSLGATQVASQADTETESKYGRETILLVEDDDAVRELACVMLQDHGYQVLTAQNASVAMTVVGEHPGMIDLLVTDVIMPGMSGPALARQLVHRSPQLRVLLMSGYPDDEIKKHAVDGMHFDLLQKPFQMDSFVSQVRAVLDNGQSV
jgi:PAS domain S-box-containing protein